MATTPGAKAPIIGTVYLLHFAHPYYHARHYVGFTTNLAHRIATHRRGRGSRLMAAVVHAEIAFIVVRTWDGVTRAFERRLHRDRHLPAMCPICAPGRVFLVIPRRNPGTEGMV